MSSGTIEPKLVGDSKETRGRSVTEGANRIAASGMTIAMIVVGAWLASQATKIKPAS